MPSYVECEFQLSVPNGEKVNVMKYEISFQHQTQNKYSFLLLHFASSVISLINTHVIQPTLISFDLCKQ